MQNHVTQITDKRLRGLFTVFGVSHASHFHDYHFNYKAYL